MTAADLADETRLAERLAEVVVMVGRTGRATHLPAHDGSRRTRCGDLWERTRLATPGIDPTCAWCRAAAEPETRPSIFQERRP